MKNNGIDDILIDASDRQEKSKGGRIFVFILIILLILGGLFYYYYFILNPKDTASDKELFIEQISKTNIKTIFSSNLYESIYSKLQKDSYEIENNIDFNNTLDSLKTEYLKDLDFSKFKMSLNNKRNVEDNLSLSEMILKYSGNDIFNFKVLTTDSEIALFSDEIYEKFVAIKYDDIKKVFDTNIDFDVIRNNNKIELTKKELINELNEYKSLILDNLQDDMFSKNENYIIRTDNQDLEVTSYVLKMDQESVNNLIVKFLEKLKSDEEFINKIISGKDNSVIFNFNETNAPIIQNLKISGIEINNKENDYNIDIKNIILSLALGNKINISNNNFILKINELIEKYKNYDGNGITATIYSTKEKVEKIDIITPNSESIEIKFPVGESVNENDIKITYVKDEQKNGFSIDIEKIDNSASTIINLLYNFIDEGKINRKFEVNLTTEGTENSKIYDNDLVISYLTNEGEANLILYNKIRFNSNSNIEGLSESNCLFLNNLNDEDASIVQTLYTKMLSVYNEKRENLRFIDYSTDYNSRNTAKSVTLEEAREALYNRVLEMYNEALNAGNEFTIQNLKDMKIDGYDVMSNVTNEKAIIVVDVYIFSIDKNFMLSNIQ